MPRKDARGLGCLLTTAQTLLLGFFKKSKTQWQFTLVRQGRYTDVRVYGCVWVWVVMCVCVCVHVRVRVGVAVCAMHV